MKIVDRKTFLAMRGQVLFCKYRPCSFGDPAIKVENCGERDFAVDYMFDSVENSGSDDLFDKLESAERDPNLDLPLDLHYTGRDGEFDENQLFAVYTRRDIRQIIDRLEEVLGSSECEK